MNSVMNSILCFGFSKYAVEVQPNFFVSSDLLPQQPQLSDQVV